MDFTTYAQLGGTVVTVVLFLNYLTKRDNKWSDSLKASSDSNVILARSLQKLTDMVERNSVANVTNTARIQENIVAVKDNTAGTEKNTEAVKTNGTNGH